MDPSSDAPPSHLRTDIASAEMDIGDGAHSPDHPNEVPLSRRRFLSAALASTLVPVGSLVLGLAPGRALGAPSDSPGGPAACVITPSQTAGPFYLPNVLVRRDIREGQPGLPLRLRVRLETAPACAPLSNAVISLWHTNSTGEYSQFLRVFRPEIPRNSLFMRGAQKTDAQGWAEFLTVFPGWYPVRTPHLHLRAYFPERNEILTTQAYFPRDLIDAIYSSHPAYVKRGRARVNNGDDTILRRTPFNERLFTTFPAGDAMPSLTGQTPLALEMKLGVKRSG